MPTYHELSLYIFSEMKRKVVRRLFVVFFALLLLPIPIASDWGVKVQLISGILLVGTSLYVLGSINDVLKEYRKETNALWEARDKLLKAATA